MTERWPSARKYRDAFEHIKTAVISLIAEGKHQPRATVTLESENLKGLNQGLTGGGSEEFGAMIREMTGQPAFWEGNRIGQWDGMEGHIQTVWVDQEAPAGGEEGDPSWWEI